MRAGVERSLDGANTETVHKEAEVSDGDKPAARIPWTAFGGSNPRFQRKPNPRVGRDTSKRARPDLRVTLPSFAL
jgi:hypothetical protein